MRNYDGDLLDAVTQDRAPNFAAPTRSRRSARASPIASSARARAARCSSGIGEKATITSLPTRARSAQVTQRVVYLEEGDVADVQRASLRDLRRERRARLAAGRSRSKTSGERSSSDRIGTSCRRRSSSSRGRSPTRWRASAASARSCSARAQQRSWRSVDAVHLLACGTSYYAGTRRPALAGGVAGLPAQAEIASEYRYRDSVPQSERAGRGRSRNRAKPPTRSPRSSTRKALGHEHTLAICNVADQLDGAADGAHLSHPRRAPRSASRRPRPSPRSSSLCSC